MLTNPSQDRSAPTQLAVELHGWFGREFSIVDVLDGRFVHRGLDDMRIAVAGVFQKIRLVAERDEPCLVDGTQDRAILLLPLLRAGYKDLVAVCRFEVSDPDGPSCADASRSRLANEEETEQNLDAQPVWSSDALQRMGQLALDKLAAQLHIGHLQSDLRHLANKIGESYEEVSLLYQMTENLRGASGAGQLSRFVLDWAVNVIPTEQAFVQILDSRIADANMGTAFLTLGQDHVDRETFGRLLNHLQPNPVGGPLVINAETTQKADWPYPVVRELILVPMRADQRNVGWFCTINHAQGGWFGTEQARLLNAAATIIGLRVMMEEIAELRQAAETASAAKSRFLANISHEFRTPLNGITSFARLLLDDASQNEAETREGLETIDLCAQRLLEHVNDLLDFSRLYSGKSHVERIPCGLRETIFSVVAKWQSRAAAKGLRLEATNGLDASAMVLSDPDRLRRVLSILVRNAIKFTEQGTIQVESHLVGDRDPALQILVRDTGIGIPPEKLTTIFDPFVQADNSVTCCHGGLGLGLAICRQTAESLGGALKVQSQYGQGSTFTLELPTAVMLKGDWAGDGHVYFGAGSEISSGQSHLITSPSK